MKELKNNIIKMALLLVCTDFCSAEYIDDINIYFVNGIMNTPQKAAESADATSSLIVRPSGTVRSIYNNSHDLIWDMVETFRLSSYSNTSSISPELFWQYFYAPRVLSERQRSDLEAMFAPAHTSYQESLPWSASADFNKMKSRISADLQANRPVLLVAHSEGNLFSNLLTSAITSENGNLGTNCMRVVSVATPDTKVANNGPWTTATTDQIIALARRTMPYGGQILPNNVETSYLESVRLGDVASHGYEETYLHQSISRNKIGNDIFVEAHELTTQCNMTPPQPAQCGNPITPTGAQGENQHFTYTFQGSSRNTLDISFEAYHIPDRLRVYAGGSLIHDTNDLVTGFHQYRVEINPQTQGNQLDLYIDAPLAGTLWKLCVDCEDGGYSCEQSLSRRNVGVSVTWGPWFSCSISNQRIDGVSYPGTYASAQLTPGRHEYDYEGVCVCTTSINTSCQSSYPKVLIDGRTYDLPNTTGFTFDIN